MTTPDGEDCELTESIVRNYTMRQLVRFIKEASVETVTEMVEDSLAFEDDELFNKLVEAVDTVRTGRMTIGPYELEPTEFESTDVIDMS